jgi:hypothetical protein
MKLTSHLPSADRERVEGRLHGNLIAWLTTVRPNGQPVTVPVWFLLRDDETILLYSRPEKDKLLRPERGKLAVAQTATVLAMAGRLAALRTKRLLPRS